MKKKIFLVGLIAVMMIAMLTGCGKKKDEDNSKYAIKYGEAKEIQGKIELTIKSNKIVNQVDPSNPKGFFTSYKAKDGYKYLDVVAEIKNITDEDITMTDVGAAKLEVGDETVDATYMCEEENGARINGYASSKKIKPNETLTFHIASQISKSLLDNDFSAKLIINTGKKYTYNMKVVKGGDNEEYEPSTINLGYKGKEIKENELVTVENSCEFTIKSNEFKDKIEPTNPTGIYYYLNAGGTNTYLNVKVSVKNIQATAVKQDTLLGSIKVVDDEGNEYKCTKVTENENGSNINTNPSTKDIEASATVQYFILAKVPKTLQTSTKPLYAQFSIDGKDYFYKIR